MLLPNFGGSDDGVTYLARPYRVECALREILHDLDIA
jgi:hypothetical protein